MSEMASQIAKAIFVGNIKGGVGKSTLTVYLTDYLRRRFKRRSVVLLDTDPQGTSFDIHPRAFTSPLDWPYSPNKEESYTGTYHKP